MENQAAKSREGDDVDEVGSDRISQLPESVLHHILCFLPQKKAVQTCVLSKSWRHLGPTRPVIDLRESCGYNNHVRGITDVCENCFDGNNESFVSVLNSTFQRCHEHNLFIQELRLDMFKVVGSQSMSILEKWIPIIFIKPNARVNAFHISFDPRWRQIFDLPSVVFKVESLRELHLKGCRLNNNDIISIEDNLMLKNLQKLSLSKVVIADEALEKVISGCPFVKSIVLDDCRGLFTVNIGNKNPYLKYFHVSCCNGNLNWYPNNTNCFPCLKSLLLSQLTLSAESFHYFSCNFPRLEELSLLDCSGFEEINLSSSSIKRLTIGGLRSSFKNVSIEVPNILYFELSNVFSPITLSLATTSSREWKSHLNLDSYMCVFGVLMLYGMVKAVSQSQISLTLSETLNFNINQNHLWDLNDHPVVLQHLDLNIRELCPDSRIRFLNVSFRIFRPRYVRDNKIGYSDGEVTKFLWKTLIRESEKTKYGWEQHLEEVSIEASDEKGILWHPVEGTCLPEWSHHQKIRFRLKWRD